VGNRHHRTNQFELIRQCREVFDTLTKTSDHTCSLRESHIEMVDGYDPDTFWCLSEHVSPEIGPCRIPMHTEQGELWIVDTIVQDVPGSADTVEIGGRDEP